MGTHFDHIIEQVVKRIAFNIELHVWDCLKQLRQFAYVRRPNVTPVWPRMNRDTVGPSIDDDARRPGDTRYAQRPRVSQQCDLI